MPWWTRWDSNPQPPECKSGALPLELPAHMATPTGLEPAPSSVTGQRDTLLHHGVILTRRKRKFIRNRTALFVLQTNVQPMNLKYSSKEILLCAPLVPKMGLEPTRVSAKVFETSLSTIPTLRHFFIVMRSALRDIIANLFLQMSRST